MTAQDLHTRAMLVKLSISAWSARKYDRKITQETNQAHGAASDAGRYNKSLMPSDAPTYKALNSHISALRLTHYAEHSHGRMRDGGCSRQRIIKHTPMQSARDSIRSIRCYQNSWPIIPALHIEAKQRLNGMYQDEDYTPLTLPKSTSLPWNSRPFQQVLIFRVTLSAGRDCNHRGPDWKSGFRIAFKDAQADACRRLYDAVARIQERLSSPDAIFRDSLIENARELCRGALPV